MGKSLLLVTIYQCASWQVNALFYLLSSCEGCIHFVHLWVGWRYPPAASYGMYIVGMANLNVCCWHCCVSRSFHPSFSMSVYAVSSFRWHKTHHQQSPSCGMLDELFPPRNNIVSGHSGTISSVMHLVFISRVLQTLEWECHSGKII